MGPCRVMAGIVIRHVMRGARAYATLCMQYCDGAASQEYGLRGPMQAMLRLPFMSSRDLKQAETTLPVQRSLENRNALSSRAMSLDFP